MKKILLAAVFLIGSMISAFATCTGPAVMHDFPGTSLNMSLATVPDGNCGSNVALPTWAGGTLGAMANYGTSPGAVLVPGMNSFITNIPAVSQSGTWTVQPGNTANTTPWLQSISQGGSTAVVKAGTAVANTDLGLVVAVSNTLNPGQAAAASSSPVVVSKNSGTGSTIAGAAVGSAGSASTEVVTVQGIASGTPMPVSQSGVVVNPCEAVAQSYTPISITTATTTRIVAPSASNKTYICSLFLTSAAADNVGIVEGTGGTCGTGTAGVVGGTTAANGPNFAANGGMLLQAGGKVSAAQTAGTNVDLCLITSAATPLAGGIKYVQAP